MGSNCIAMLLAVASHFHGGLSQGGWGREGRGWDLDYRFREEAMSGHALHHLHAAPSPSAKNWSKMTNEMPQELKIRVYWVSHGFPRTTIKLSLIFKISEIVQRISIIVRGVPAHPTVCGRSLSCPETIHKSAHQRLESGKPLSAASSPDKALGLHLGGLTLPTLSQNSNNVPSSLSLKMSLKPKNSTNVFPLVPGT